jgi:cellulose synthase/poly-beta-1,6-N-acetylglucosamine synthase-like glycosyltransferase
MTLCSVVIPTRKRPDQLDRALASLDELECRDFEIIVVDNSPGDEAVRRITEKRGARLIVEPRRGVSFARNRGAAESRGEIAAFLDDDVIVDRNWLGALVAEFEDQSVMMVSGPYLPLGSAAYDALYNPGPARWVLDANAPGWLERAAFASPARGGNMALRTSVFKSWPGFEPELGRGTPLRAFPRSEVLASGADDGYAVLQLVERGYKFVYTPGAIVRHPFPQSVEELRAFHFRMLTGWGMYMGFLFSHGYKRAVLKHVVRKFAGERLRKGAPIRDPFPLAIKPISELLAAAKGVILYSRIVLARKLFRLDSSVITVGPRERKLQSAT